MPYKDPAKQREVCNRLNREKYANDPAHRQRVLERSRERSRECLKRMAEYKATLVCNRCGETHPSTIEFHHPGGKDKDFSVSETATRRWDKIMAEIAKCEVLCANCHRKQHWSERVWMRETQ